MIGTLFRGPTYPTMPHMVAILRAGLLNALARAMVGDFALGDLVDRDGNRLVGVDRVLVDKGLAREILAPVGRRLLLHANPVIQLARALGDDVDEAELGIGMGEQFLQVAENG